MRVFGSLEMAEMAMEPVRLYVATMRLVSYRIIHTIRKTLIKGAGRGLPTRKAKCTDWDALDGTRRPTLWNAWTFFPSVGGANPPSTLAMFSGLK